MLNEVIIIGRLTRHPELRTSSQGKSFVPFTVACNRMNNEVVFVPCFAWNKTAENMNKYLSKGSLVAVTGYLSSRKQEQNNGKNYESLFVTARNVTFLERSSARGSDATPTQPEDFTIPSSPAGPVSPSAPPTPTTAAPENESNEAVKFTDDNDIIWD